MNARTCIHPLNDPDPVHGCRPVFDARGVRRRCAKPVPSRRAVDIACLCDGHLAAVSAGLDAYIARCLREPR